MNYIVELQPGCWLTDEESDPGRTLKKIHAQRYETQREAADALEIARQYRPFTEARILPAPTRDGDLEARVEALDKTPEEKPSRKFIELFGDPPVTPINLDEMWHTPSTEGWRNKPHRFLYDCLREIFHLRKEVARLRTALQKEQCSRGNPVIRAEELRID